MKKVKLLINLLFTSGLLLILIGLIILRQDDIITIIHNYILPKNAAVSLGEKNSYYRDYDFIFIKNTSDFSPKNYQDILNIYYTAINAGKNEFTFYCPSQYDQCLTDIQRLANDQTLLSDINNYVHPFNSFSHIETEYDTLGRVSIRIIKTYKDDEIKLIEEQVGVLYNQLVIPTNSVEDNIRNVHDYIINHAKYDSVRSDQNIVNYKSNIAYGPLFEGYAICGGYTDLMELFLEKMGIKSFKVSSDDHVWNAVFLNNNWYHLDLTWDDPVSRDGKDYLEHNYFLISTEKLLTLEKSQHIFNFDSYPELKEA